MPGKNTYMHKWDITILEQVADKSNLVSNARNEDDWELFLKCIYESIHILNFEQRMVLLLSQEIGLTYIDIARIMGKPLSTIVGLLRAAVAKISFFIKARSLTRPNKFDCKALQQIYESEFTQEELDKYEPAAFEFLEQFQHDEGDDYQVNYLIDKRSRQDGGKT